MTTTVLRNKSYLDSLKELNKRLDEAIELFKPLEFNSNQKELWEPAKIDRDVINFMEEYKNISSKFPEMFPLINIKLHNQDLNIVGELWSLKNKTDKLSGDINMLLLQKGNNSLNKTMILHKTLTNASRRDLPGAKTMLELINKRNPFRKNRKSRQT